MKDTTMSKVTGTREALLNKMERTSGIKRMPKVRLGISLMSQNTSRRHQSNADDKRTVDQVMQFEVVGNDHPDVINGSRPPDDLLVVMLKNEINAVGLSRRDLYAFVGAGDSNSALFENENQAYNLEYGLRKRPTISLDCAVRWLAVIGKRLSIEFLPLED